MLSAEQLIIVAYYSERTGVLCRKCGEADPEMKMGQALSAYEAGEFAGSNGLDCESCYATIEEPYEWTCPSCDTSYSGDEAVDAENEYGWGAAASHKCSEDCAGEEDSE